MDIELDYQVATERPGLPGQEEVLLWVSAALTGRAGDEAELTVRVVDEAESADLNETYRHKAGPTNVLSFPFEAPEGVELPLLGDIVVCDPVVAAEAAAQGKAYSAHFAHMVVHGCLHLLGYDHIDPAEAEAMETLETEILTGLGYSDPYAG
jgi:probable rRNA maturation factor